MNSSNSKAHPFPFVPDELTSDLRDSGIEVVGKVPWGTHFCQFYQGQPDLVDLLVPYFAAGLKNNEFCMWVTSEPLKAAEAKAALERALPDVDEYIRGGQLEILDYADWYLRSGRFDSKEILQGWVEKLGNARKKGFEGLRLTGNTHWLEANIWKDFEQYEAAVNSVIREHNMIALCSYALSKCGAMEILDVVANHQFALVRRKGAWSLIETSSHKLVGEALKSSEARFRSLFEHTSEGIAIHELITDAVGDGVDYRILDVNPAFESITGIPKKRAVQTLASTLYGTDKAPYLDKYATVVKTGRSTKFEVFFAPMGKHFVISAFSPEKGKFATVFSDITEQKNMEEVSRKRAEDLESSNAELQQFAYVASHDLQEPLRMVVNSLGILERRSKGRLEAKDLEYLDLAIDGGMRMKSLIDDLLLYSRVDSDERKRGEVKMDDVVVKTVHVLQGTIDDLKGEVSWSDLPVVNADESQMLQLMQNLIGNALKFHGPEPPRVHISGTERYNDFLFKVQDNGIGIRKEHHERIFQMFSRLNHGEVYKGNGIGLAIAEKIVEGHGGKIWVESEEGKGSTFLFTIEK
ncbi:MAG TPA: MEDS domain-containing protein [Methanomassiliicoccales archaeon]|nr:MEDS domain-containing protein [Methanomassiliicoccales archaeon]